jgi:hypothetical protein
MSPTFDVKTQNDPLKVISQVADPQKGAVERKQILQTINVLNFIQTPPSSGEIEGNISLSELNLHTPYEGQNLLPKTDPLAYWAYHFVTSYLLSDPMLMNNIYNLFYRQDLIVSTVDVS